MSARAITHGGMGHGGAAPNARAAAAIAIAVAFAAHAVPAPAADDVPSAAATAVLPDIEVAAERLDRARNALSPKTGSSQYRFDDQDIARLPRGDATPVNQFMLQAPGVVQGDYGELHIRGEMTQPQYRINGVIIPEGIGGFGQTFDTRMASRVDFLTGALPAQYGYRTAGVIELTTRKTFENGGRISLYGGSGNTFNPSLELSGQRDRLGYYLLASGMQNDVGILAPTGDRNPGHDRTTQFKGLSYLSYTVDDVSRVSLVLGSAVNRFQIPDVPGQQPHFSIDGAGTVPNLPSDRLDANQRELNNYAVLAWQAAPTESFDYQVALFGRYTSVNYHPDPIGDLIYRGVSSEVARRNEAGGVQADSTWYMNDRHVLRFGFQASYETTASGNRSTVFATDNAGNQLAGGPFTLVDDSGLHGYLMGFYAQDEWHPVERLTVNYGARLDYLDASTRSGQLSPRVGLVYQATAATKVHAGYSRYFTPPRLELVAPKTLALFANTTNAAEVQESSPVMPERMHYYDVGVTQQLTPSWTLGVDTYYKQVRQVGDFGQFGAALVFAPFNWDQGRMSGVELSINYHGDALSGYFNLARQRAVARGISSGQFNFGQAELDYINGNWVHMDHDQTWTASGGVAWKAGELTVTADMFFGSGMRATPDGGTPNSDHLPSYTQVNLGVQRRFQCETLGRFDGRVAIVNALDKVYMIRDGTGVGVGAPQFGPRRGIFAGITREF